jgi:phosphoribosylformylglycinamidine (FGAM) synthase PurS component
MLSYLQKFNALDPDLREKISSPQVMSAMQELGKQYGVSLATVVMRVMAKEISILDLSKFFVFEFDMDAKKAEKLVEEMKEKLFADVADYLGFSLDSTEVESEKLEDWIGKQKQATGIRTSDFFFSPEDEEEVKELTRKLESFGAKKEEDTEIGNLKEIVEEAAQRINLNFSSSELSERMKQILSTYIKGVRNKIDSKGALMKDVASGGLDLNDDLSSRILSVTDKVKEEMADKSKFFPVPRFKVPEDAIKSSIREEAVNNVSAQPFKGVAPRDIDYDFSALAKKGPIKDIKTEEISKPEVISLKELNLRVSPVQEEREKEIQIDNDSDLGKLDYKKPVFQNSNQPVISGKVRMEDVKFVPKLTGPIDELKEMSIVDFRRLGLTADESAEKIIEKIHFLEKDSYKKRLEGIKSWRECPVNKAYLKIGQSSINLNRSISDVISGGQDSLTVDEFYAVMELNKKLRF